MDKVADFHWGIRSGGPVPNAIPEQLVPQTFTDAYRAQSILVERILAAASGGPAEKIGYKIACTSKIARQLFGADGPVFGRLLSCSSWPTGKTLSAAEFPMIALESEFAFRMARDVPESSIPWTRETISPFIGEMLPALEFVAHRFSGWSAYSSTSLAADNAVNHGWIHGEATTDWREVELADHPVALRVNGEKILTGTGANVMGHPLHALAWLANALPAHGLELREGDLVTTGVCTDVHVSRPGECVQADFGTLGTVEVNVAE